MKILHRLVILCCAAAFAAGAHATLQSPAVSSGAGSHGHASLYSFSDLYRLTVNGATPEPIGIASFNTEPQQVRVATVQAAAGPEVRFSITPVPGPGRWMLLLAGLAAAAWVAHRRLTRAL